MPVGGDGQFAHSIFWVLLGLVSLVIICCIDFLHSFVGWGRSGKDGMGEAGKEVREYKIKGSFK